MTRQWYAVHTRPTAENRAEINLRWQGFKCYLPSIRKTVRHARRKKIVMAPFFPRYIFVTIDLERDSWHSINGTFGVSHLVMFNNRPAPVPEGFVEYLKDTLNTDHSDIECNLRVNENAQIVDGPFSDLIGKVQNIDAQGRVKVLLELLGRTVPVFTTSSNLIASK